MRTKDLWILLLGALTLAACVACAPVKATTSPVAPAPMAAPRPVTRGEITLRLLETVERLEAKLDNIERREQTRIRAIEDMKSCHTKCRVVKWTEENSDVLQACHDKCDALAPPGHADSC